MNAPTVLDPSPSTLDPTPLSALWTLNSLHHTRPEHPRPPLSINLTPTPCQRLSKAVPSKFELSIKTVTLAETEAWERQREQPGGSNGYGPAMNPRAMSVRVNAPSACSYLGWQAAADQTGVGGGGGDGGGGGGDDAPSATDGASEAHDANSDKAERQRSRAIDAIVKSVVDALEVGGA